MGYTLNDLVKVNIARVFRVAYYDMVKHEEKPSVALLWEYFERYLDRAVAVAVKDVLFRLKYQGKGEPELICNLLSHSPVEEGRDVTKNAQYFNTCADGVGLATMTDSFVACE